jgi:hypothetical protein
MIGPEQDAKTAQKGIKMSKLFVLGAKDPEMNRIYELLQRKIGHTVQYATKDGVPCHPGNAYKCDPVSGEEVIYIECRPEGMAHAQIDHHWPGDPGYGLPSKRFWEASSLGQVYRLLGIMKRPSQSDLVLAAMDHCPAHAIRGECPGVSAEDVIERKIQEISVATKVSHDDVRDRINLMAKRLESAPEIEIGGQHLKDLRQYDNGSGYTLDLLTSQVATLAGGYAVLLFARDREGDAVKWTVAGHCTPECIEAFKNTWGPANGLTGIYGVPSRGYAGGYLK